VAGAYAPPFGERSVAEVTLQDAAIKESGADIVWVALGTPKQDTEALRVLESTGITTVAVGAAFDFTAGTARVAPDWMRRANLEWLYRLGSEPRRLWRRYLFGNLKFLWLAVRHTASHRRMSRNRSVRI
jgi:N-acetylglucosaminyldiphosphoundecaprenol N-acetyl-beta-D-mannosaminyltransferase